MAKSEKKIKKTVWLTPSTLELLEGYRGVTKEDQSNAIETLVIKGFDNVSIAEQISKSVKDELKNIRVDNKKHTDRIVNVLIGLTRFVGRIYSINLTGFLRLEGFKREEVRGQSLYELEKHGIQKAMEELKWRNKENEKV